MTKKIIGGVIVGIATAAGLFAVSVEANAFAPRPPQPCGMCRYPSPSPSPTLIAASPIASAPRTNP